MEQRSIRLQALSGALWKFLERIGAQLVSMIVTIVLARLLNPEDYSIVSIVGIFFAFANILIGGGFNSALIHQKDADEEDYASALFLTLGVAFFLYGVMFFCAPAIAHLYEEPVLIQVIRIMGLILPVNAAKSIVCAYISAHLQFRKFFFATLGGTLASAAVGIGMAYAGLGAWALVAQQMTNAIVDTLILWLTTRMPIAFKISWMKIRRLFAYGWHIFASSLIHVIYTEISPLFVGLRYTATDLAFYTKGRSFPDLLSNVCTYTLVAVLFPVLSKFQDEKQKLLSCTRRFIQLSTFIVFPTMLGFFAIAENFVAALLTEKWLPMVPYLQIFCISELFVSVQSGNREVVKALGRSDLFLWLEILRKIGFFAIVGAVMLFSHSPLALAYAAIGCTVVAVIVTCLPNVRLIGYRIKDQICDMLPNLICAAAMCIVVSSIDISETSPFWEMIVQLLSGVAAYIAACLLIRNPNLPYMWTQIRQMIKRG